MIEAIISHVHTIPGGERLVTVDDWPQRIEITAYLETFDPTVVRRDGDRITIAVANGLAVYLVTREDAARLVLECELEVASLGGVTWYGGERRGNR